MTDWKMPEWLRNILDYFGWVAWPNMDRIEEYRILVKFVTKARDHSLLLTPSERDANDKRIAELEAEVGRLRAILTRQEELKEAPDED